MKISIQRLSSKLLTSGFRLAYAEERSGSLCFVRRFASSLFARIEVHQGKEPGGRTGDLVAGHVACAIIPGRLFIKGTGESRCLTELTPDPTGWSKLSGTADAEAWEDRLATIGPHEAHEFCAHFGPQVFAETASVRSYAERCLALCKPFAKSPATLLSRLRKHAAEWQRAECKRLLSCWIPCLPDGELVSEVAVFATVLFAGEITGDPRWTIGKDPDSWTERDLRCIVVYLQSRLGEEIGWRESFWTSSIG